MKKPVIAWRLHSGDMTFCGTKIKTMLPVGCIGVCFVFESKKAARKYWGKEVSLHEIEIGTKKPE